MAGVRRVLWAAGAAVVALSLVTPVSSSPEAAAAPSKPDADRSVITVDRQVHATRPAPDMRERTRGGSPLARAEEFNTEYPKPGEDTVEVPSQPGQSARVAETAVSVTAPDEDAADGSLAADEVSVDVMAHESAQKAGGHGVVLRVSAAETTPSADEVEGDGSAANETPAESSRTTEPSTEPATEPEQNPESNGGAAHSPSGGGATLAQGASADDVVGLRVDVSGFRRAFGGDFESRLRLVQKPACVLQRPTDVECSTGTPVPSHVDLTSHEVVAEAVPVDQQSVFVIAAAPNGETGSPTATKLKASGEWAVGDQSGDFSWSLPVPAVPAPAGDAPEFKLAYSSQAVDGLVSAENNQPSWVGQGWDVGIPYLERRYRPCYDDGINTSSDLCWAGEHLVLSMNGVSSQLVKDPSDASGNTFRVREDAGWRVRRHTGASNGARGGEYWIVTTPDGTQFYFGRGTQATTGAETKSTWTVPVFGDDTGEPCKAATFAASYCTQAWRWNLDWVRDRHENSSTYFYQYENNRYARQGDPAKTTPYHRGGYLQHIDYGYRYVAGQQPAPTSRLDFQEARRCVEFPAGGGTCPAFNLSNSESFPDVPMDSYCTSGQCTGDNQKAPTFFAANRLASITAQRSGGTTAWSDVDRLTLSHAFPEPSDGTTASLWLDKVQHTGLSGGGSQSLPAVEFTGTEFVNRADANPGAGVPFQRKLRITRILDELGRQVDVTYQQPDGCNPIPEGNYDTNTRNCFPAWRVNGDDDAGFGVWHKYLTTKVRVRDTVGGSPDQTTQYAYSSGTDANEGGAWRYDDDPITLQPQETWSVWRGYQKVDVTTRTSGGTAHTLRESLFYRGMYGDRLAGGGTKTDTITDSTGTTKQDLAWLDGRVREIRDFHINNAGSADYELEGSLHDYTSARTTQGGTNPSAAKDAHLVVEDDTTTRQTVIEDGSGNRSSRSVRVQTTFDSYGQPTDVQDTAGTDIRCTKTSYARDTTTISNWTVAYPHRERLYKGNCAAPTALARGTDTYFDSDTTLGGTVTNGDPQRVDKAKTATGLNPTAVVTTKATFDAYGRAVSATDANGETSTTAFSPATGRLSTTTATNPLGHTTVTTLDPDRQQPTKVVDANNKATTSAYDPLGRLTSVRMPEQASGDPAAYTFAYRVERGQAPRVSTKQLQSGSTYVNSWAFLDGLGRARQTQTVSPASTEGTPKTIVSNTRYDELGNTAAEAMPVVVNGTAGSALLSIPSGEVDETRHTYDSLNRVVRSEQYGQGTKLWETQTAHYGDHTRTTPPAGSAVQTVWTDRRGREIKKQQGTGASLVSTDYTYTTTDQLALMTDPGGHTSTYTHDLLDRRIAADDTDAGKSKTTFDDNGNPTAVFDAKAIAAGGTTPSISTGYDELNRPTARWEGNSGTGTKIATWTYDTLTNGKGRLTKQTTHEGSLDYSQEVTSYDARGRVTESKWTFPGGLLDLGQDQTFTAGYGYDTADHQTSIEYKTPVTGAPAETVTTTYDSLGYPTTLAGSQTYLAGTDYAADGKLAGRAYANPNNPISRAYGYSTATQRLSQVQTNVGGDVEQDDRYTWDDSGNLTRILDQQTSAPIASCYTYDSLARLRHAWTTDTTDCSDSSSTTTADGPAGYNKAWNYSGDGNITSIRNRSTTRTFSYDDNAHPHAATQAGPDDFTYDANGSMVERSKDLIGDLIPSKLEYDNQHQLKSVSRLLAPVDETNFVYLPDGTRIARIDPLGLTATLYVDRQEIKVVAGLLELGARYYQHEDTTVAIRQTTGLTWQLNDHQSSAQIAVASGTSIATRTYYDPYGNERTGSLPPPTDRGWLGQTHDDTTGLTHLNARYYDPDINRFITTDPLVPNTDAQAANAYNYAASNPNMYSDPSGLTPCVQPDDCRGYEYTYGKGLSKTRGSGPGTTRPGALSLLETLIGGNGFPAEPLGPGNGLGEPIPSPTGHSVNVDGDHTSLDWACIAPYLCLKKDELRTVTVTRGGPGPDATLGEQLGYAMADVPIFGSLLRGRAFPSTSIRVAPGTLAAHEAAGGHALARHVGKTDAELLARLSAQPGITGASTFASRAVAEGAVGDLIAANSGRIGGWMSGSGHQLVLNGRTGGTTGRYVARGSTNVRDVTGVRAVLVRDSTMLSGYRVQTAFPKP